MHAADIKFVVGHFFVQVKSVNLGQSSVYGTSILSINSGFLVGVRANSDLNKLSNKQSVAVSRIRAREEGNKRIVVGHGVAAEELLGAHS